MKTRARGDFVAKAWDESWYRLSRI